MYPILFHLGPITLHTYGLLAALGFLAGYALATRRAKQAGLSPSLVGDALTPVVVSGILGARIFYVVFHGSEFSGAWLDTLKIWQGGLMWQGGFLGALSALVIFARRKKVPFLFLADLFAPAAALGQAVGRIGCLFAGCCFGHGCAFPWAVTFRHSESLAPLGVPLHPTQLYDAGLNLLICFVLIRVPWGKPIGSSSPPQPSQKSEAIKFIGSGRIAGLYLILAGLARLAVEPFRADARGAGIGLFSATGLVALAIVFAGTGLTLWTYRRTK
ncbi:MAG: prolipoprotein diacylglyceryl transferase [Elusimicrobia bacterium]|nr:prolipoprotein diacylglyceryl transferase [Elusimicrobiota bacterium]